MKMKIIIAVVVLLPVLLHAGYAVAASPVANYYITIDEYIARSASTPVRIGGEVVPGSIRWDGATRTIRFTMVGENAKTDVVYRGIAPDSFRDGVTAIVDGARTLDGSFAATLLIVKCPHQYLSGS